MRHYETIYIVNPNLAEEVNKEVIEKFSNMVQKHDGVVVKVDEWGNKRLAYQIKKNDYGYYVLMDYCGGSQIIAELERELKLDDRIVKYQTVKLEDHVDPQALILKVQQEQAKGTPAEDQRTEKGETSPASEDGTEERETSAASEDGTEERKTSPASENGSEEGESDGVQ